jgi:GNAT superfamily N-acetyltransferase
VDPLLRPAVPSDAPAIADLMRASVLDLFPAYYDETQTASAAVHIAALDAALIEDGTYYVAEAGGEIVACGGWSRRNKLYNGTEAGADERLLDPATDPARIRAMFVRGDWTRRGLGRAILTSCVDAARAEGFASLALMATLPGVPLYKAFGFTELEQAELRMPDDVVLGGVAMERGIDGPPHPASLKGAGE